MEGYKKEEWMGVRIEDLKYLRPTARVKEWNIVRIQEWKDVRMDE